MKYVECKWWCVMCPKSESAAQQNHSEPLSSADLIKREDWFHDRLEMDERESRNLPNEDSWVYSNSGNTDVKLLKMRGVAKTVIS